MVGNRTGIGLSRAALESAAQIYVDSDRVIGIYGMGLTQHVHGFQNVAMLVNMLLLKGNIGRDGAGISPVRGHSNVQGQRTVGISEKVANVPMDRYAAQFGFEPPRDNGMNTVEACEGLLSGKVKAFIGLGGNFVRAIPERVRMEQAWANMQLTVQVATKLNHSHLVNGRHRLLAAMPGAHRTGSAGKRPASRHGGRYVQLHPRLARAPPPGEPAFAL